MVFLGVPNTVTAHVWCLYYMFFYPEQCVLHVEVLVILATYFAMVRTFLLDTNSTIRHQYCI